jgi:squalene synthase HpnC
MAFYGFARLIDYLGDEYPGDRLAALDWAEYETRRAFEDGHAVDLHPLVSEAVRSAHQVGLTPEPFLRLIAANRRDQTVARYETFDDLVEYCSLSADPVGRLVLGAFGVSDGPQVQWSDSICTGLQLVEHWQDVVEDAESGRVYIPQTDLRRFGVDGADLLCRRPPTPALRALMAFEVCRARQRLDAGRPLLASLHGRARFAVTGFWTGGHAALDAISANRFDVFSASPRPSKTALGARTLSGFVGLAVARRER